MSRPPLLSTNLCDGPRLRVLLYFCQQSPAADGAVGTGDTQLRLGVLAEEGGDAGEMGQVLESNGVKLR